MQSMFHKLRRPLPQRLVAGCTVIPYLIASLGLPVPAGAAPKDSSQPFPCQQHACGCQSAEQCWTHCCCFTPEQRWAWAEANNVKPPAYAEKPAGSGWRTARQRDKESDNCDYNQSSPCCRKSTQSAQSSPLPKKNSQGKSKKGSWALSVQALACQGHSTSWASVGSVLPSGAAVAWSPCFLPLGRLVCRDEIAFLMSAVVPEPPPRSPAG